MSKAAPLAVAPRPIRQARTVATRRRLLDAAVGCLVERGYARTSTTAVCARAGVSQGALFKHFPSKNCLLGAAAEHLFHELVEDFRRAIAAEPRDDRLTSALSLLWRAFTSPRLQAAFELYLAARSDDDLRAALAPVLAQHRATLRREARALFPDAAASHPEFEAIVDTVLDTMQGAALSRSVLAEEGEQRRQLAFLERMVAREFGNVGESG